MSYVGSIFHIIDNTGGLKVKCLCAYGKRKITFGSYVLLVLKRIKPNNKKLQKGFKMLENKVCALPKKKHGNIPL